MSQRRLSLRSSAPKNKVQPAVIRNIAFHNTNQLKYLLATIRTLRQSEFAADFLEPVDIYKWSGILDYYDVIKRPMDLGTIEKRLKNMYYCSAKEALRDFNMMFNNCYKFNAQGSYVHENCKKLQALFEERLQAMPQPECAITARRKSMAATAVHSLGSDAELKPLIGHGSSVAVAPVPPVPQRSTTIGNEANQAFSVGQGAAPLNSKPSRQYYVDMNQMSGLPLVWPQFCPPMPAQAPHSEKQISETDLIRNGVQLKSSLNLQHNVEVKQKAGLPVKLPHEVSTRQPEQAHAKAFLVGEGPKLKPKALRQQAMKGELEKEGSSMEQSLDKELPKYDLLKAPLPQNSVQLLQQSASSMKSSSLKLVPKTASVFPKLSQYELLECTTLLKTVMQINSPFDVFWPFLKPLTPKVIADFKAEQYIIKISNPIYFVTVQAKLKKGAYVNLHEFKNDLDKIFSNFAKAFPKTHQFYFMAKQAHELMDDRFKKMLDIMRDPFTAAEYLKLISDKKKLSEEAVTHVAKIAQRMEGLPTLRFDMAKLRDETLKEIKAFVDMFLAHQQKLEARQSAKK